MFLCFTFWRKKGLYDKNILEYFNKIDWWMYFRNIQCEEIKREHLCATSNALIYRDHIKIYKTN